MFSEIYQYFSDTNKPKKSNKNVKKNLNFVKTESSEIWHPEFSYVLSEYLGLLQKLLDRENDIKYNIIKNKILESIRDLEDFENYVDKKANISPENIKKKILNHYKSLEMYDEISTNIFLFDKDLFNFKKVSDKIYISLSDDFVGEILNIFSILNSFFLVFLKYDAFNKNYNKPNIVGINNCIENMKNYSTITTTEMLKIANELSELRTENFILKKENK